MTSERNATELSGGRIEGQVHVFPVRVYYEDTDFSGFVYHANYLKFIERGRSEFLRICGIGHQQLLRLNEPLFWTLRTLTATFIRPARIEDSLHIRTAVAELGGARMLLRQWIMRDREKLLEAAVEVCLINAAGRPRRVPGLIRRELEMYIRTRDNHANHEEE